MKLFIQFEGINEGKTNNRDSVVAFAGFIYVLPVYIVNLQLLKVVIFISRWPLTDRFDVIWCIAASLLLYNLIHLFTI